MPEARLELFDGHLVVDTGARLLVDTGSPVSFASSGRIDWAEQAHEVSTTALGLDVVRASDTVIAQVENAWRERVGARDWDRLRALLIAADTRGSA